MSIEGIISDTHNHNWSVFSHQLPNGVNSRLQHILDETWRAAEMVKEKGGDTLIHTGDIFHVRGSVAPSVLNPTVELYSRIYNDLGLNVYLLAGNHDLEGNNSSTLGNAGEALTGAGVWVISNVFADEKNKRLFIPYFDSCDKVREHIEKFIRDKGSDAGEIAQWCLYMHAPLNGVLSGIPDHGFSPDELQAYGFKRVFCGHYHNHKDFGVVVSVGALTHQTFSDVGSKAGFVLHELETGLLTHYTSNAPRFVDFDPEWDEMETFEQVNGHFVRVRLESATNEEVEEVRKFLNEQGAASVQVIHVPKVEVSREGGSSIEAGASIRVSLHDWCRARGFDEVVGIESQKIMDEVEAKV
ncbi:MULTISPECIES: metallophosphoesterase [Aeromonas]|uniref:metallophosphoesterase n=1 Tax=Aeromonas TaxID=642 RepID=UPI001396C162|nr:MULTISPECIES: metallophosphoesterase [Aeromonas]MCD6619960.1 metallophosphoesterase [Aeromonas veronii]MDD9227854.1 metallophosphoesterase [Aeromonas hydrophila]QWZ66445.1 metallophosphoesterase [Aeromonas sp. FDAARGOS 1417]BEE07022.1 exonuclease [Aeromonas veronii]